MDREKIKNISVIVAVSSAVICIISIFFSYRVYVSSQNLVTEYRDDLSALRLSYAELEKQYKPTDNNLGQTPLKKSPLTAGGGDVAASDHRKKVQELARIIRSTGLDQLAANEDLDPSILSRIYEDYALQDQVSNYREQTVARSRALHEIDRNQYNDKFSNIVTDRGTEAMPNLENYLAYSYIQEGRVEDALVFIGSLERKYANSFVLTRGADRRLKWISANSILFPHHNILCTLRFDTKSYLGYFNFTILNYFNIIQAAQNLNGGYENAMPEVSV